MDSPPLITADLSKISTPTDLPTDVYRFMIKNATSRQRSKLMETGKFFYPKEFVKIRRAGIGRDEMKCFQKEENGTNRDVTAELTQSLWIAQELFLIQSTDAMFRLLPKTAAWNLQTLAIDQAVISYENFKYLTSSGRVELLLMVNARIQYNDDKQEVPFEKIFELLPNCSELAFTGNAPSTVSREAANAHRPLGLRVIHLKQLDEKFDFETFSSFMLSNQNVHYVISFKNGISADYSKELESVTMKINQVWENQTELPVIQLL